MQQSTLGINQNTRNLKRHKRRILDWIDEYFLKTGEVPKKVEPIKKGNSKKEKTND